MPGLIRPASRATSSTSACCALSQAAGHRAQQAHARMPPWRGHQCWIPFACATGMCTEGRYPYLSRVPWPLGNEFPWLHCYTSRLLPCCDPAKQELGPALTVLPPRHTPLISNHLHPALAIPCHVLHGYLGLNAPECTAPPPRFSQQRMEQTAVDEQSRKSCAPRRGLCVPRMEPAGGAVPPVHRHIHSPSQLLALTRCQLIRADVP